MKTKIKAVTAATLSFCIMAASFTACAPVRTPRTGTGTSYNTTQQRINRTGANNMVGTGYGSNYMSATGYGPNYVTGTGVNPNFTGSTVIPGTPVTPGRPVTPGVTGTVIKPSDASRAAAIRSQLQAMKGIRNVNVGVNGDTCVVGVTTTSNNLAAVRQDVVNRIKKTHPTITKVYVTDSPDIMTRLNQFTNNAARTMDNNAVKTQFDQIIRSLTPNLR